MKIVIISDPHIGDYSYGRTDSATGLNTRLLDFLKNLDQSVDFAIERRADAFVIVGDIYRQKHPSSKIRKQFVPRIKRLIKKKIRVILMTGNHDMTTSADGAHALSEMQELCELVAGLEVYSSPVVLKLNDDLVDVEKDDGGKLHSVLKPTCNTELYILPFVNRGAEKLLTVQDFLTFQKNKIDEFNKLTCKSKAEYKLFFGHFGTDKSVIGNSFDLDMSVDENENKITLPSFDAGKWTKIYLGHIHQQQEFNSVSRHVGSIGRVDFAEEKEQKGFYYFCDGNDEFVPIGDREFRTFRLKLNEDDCKQKLSTFFEKVKKWDLRQAIVRVKVDVLQTYLPTLKFTDLENWLRENTWHSLGVDINIIADETINDDAGKITTADLPIEALKKHIERHPDRFKGIEEKAMAVGREILEKVHESASAN